MTDQIAAAARGTAFAPPAGHGALAECLACVLAGVPLPEAYRPAVAAVGRPATVREGIERIVTGGR